MDNVVRYSAEAGERLQTWSEIAPNKTFENFTITIYKIHNNLTAGIWVRASTGFSTDGSATSRSANNSICAVKQRRVKVEVA